MNGFKGDFSLETPPTPSSERVALIAASAVIVLACCTIGIFLALWLGLADRVADRGWAVAFFQRVTPTFTPTLTPAFTPTPSPTPTAAPTLTPTLTATPSPTFTPEPTDTPNPTDTPAPMPTPLPVVKPTAPPLFADTGFESQDFGRLSQPYQTDLELYRWYLLQAAPDSLWVDRVDLSQEGRGYGLRTIDYRSCTALCGAAAVQIVPAKEDQLYILSVELKQDPTSDDSVIYLDFLDENRVSLEAGAQAAGTGTQWHKQTLSARAPAGTRFVRVILYSTNKGQGIYSWDNVNLEVEP